MKPRLSTAYLHGRNVHERDNQYLTTWKTESLIRHWVICCNLGATYMCCHRKRKLIMRWPTCQSISVFHSKHGAPQSWHCFTGSECIYEHQNANARFVLPMHNHDNFLWNTKSQNFWCWVQPECHISLQWETRPNDRLLCKRCAFRSQA